MKQKLEFIADVSVILFLLTLTAALIFLVIIGGAALVNMSSTFYVILGIMTIPLTVLIGASGIVACMHLMKQIRIKNK